MSNKNSRQLVRAFESKLGICQICGGRRCDTCNGTGRGTGRNANDEILKEKSGGILPPAYDPAKEDEV